MAVFAVISAFYTPYDINFMDAAARLAPPSAAHLFGTDNLGRDIFSRAMTGTRFTLLVAMATVLSSAFIGTVLGLASGYIGGWPDEVMMRLIDAVSSYPGILIFAIAAYTFYRITMTIVRLLRAKKGTDPLFAAAAFIDCSFAVTSMFTLQTAMFASFSPELDVRLPNILTGTGVVILITGLSGYMILHGGRNLRRLEETGWKT